MTVVVWYQLDNKDRDKVIVKPATDTATDADVADLRVAIKTRWGDHLASLDPGDLKVFPAGADPKTSTPLESYDPIPPDTTGRNPLIVVSPQQDGKLRCCCSCTVLSVLGWSNIDSSCILILVRVF